MARTNNSLDFSLAGFNAASAMFTGRFAVDNSVTAILLNGNSLGASGGGFSSWTDFSANSGFNAGLNTLTFVVRNSAQASGNPTGLRVEFTSSDASVVPEPATWALMILGFGMVGVAARRSRPVAIAA
jgi:hypothetical protein